MAYATLADLIARFGEEQMVQLTDRAGSGVIDPAVSAQALADADALIDGHLAGRYPVPLSPAPAVLVGMACDLARRNLYPDALPDAVENRAREAVRFLEQIGRGALSLGGLQQASDNRVQLVAGTNQKVFGRDAR